MSVQHILARKMPSQWMRFLRRASWSVADQSLSSATNFALTLVVARSVSATQFGAFALLQGTYYVVVEISRSVTSEPLIIRFSDGDTDERVHATRDAAGFTLLIALTLSSVLLLVLPLVPSGELRRTCLVFAVCLPGLLLQDFWRFAFVARRHPQQAFVNDAVWTLAQTGGLLLLIRFGEVSLSTLVLVWSLSAVLASVYGLRQFGSWPRPTSSLSWYRTHRDLGKRFAAESLAYQGSSQFVIYALGVVSGLAAAGAFRGAQLVYGPIIIMVLAARLVVLPELVRLYQRRPTHLKKAVSTMSSLVLLASATWGFVALQLSDSVGREIFGETWFAVEPLLVFVVIDRICHSLAFGALLGLRAIADARRSLLAQIVAAGLRLSFSIVGASLDGARGAVIAVAVASPIQSLVWWYQFNAGYKATRRGMVVSSSAGMSESVR